MNKVQFQKKFDIIANKCNIKYQNIDLYYEAFVHPSYANEHNLDFHYERLEFLGDAILDFLVAEYLYKTKDFHEGQMTKVRAKYVCEQANSDYTQELNLHDCLMVGKGAKKQGEDQKDSVLGNLFESFLGAVYLSTGIKDVKKILEKEVFPLILARDEKPFIDYKSRLQEYIQAEKRSDLNYVVDDVDGPPHKRVFTMSVTLDGIRLGTGKGSTKKDASQEAARIALEKMAVID